jgi:HK97 gp10 family phage protein
MASFNFTGLDELISQLSAVSDNIDDACMAASEAGAAVALEAIKESVPVRTGALRDHIKIADKGYSATDGYWCDIYPTGMKPGNGNPDARRYATVGFVLEYGRSNMRARPWMRPAVEREEERIHEAMERELMARLGL